MGSPKNRVCQGARNQYGCRVLQRLFEHCTPDQLYPIVEVLVANVQAFSKHVFANYVMQHFFEFGELSYHKSVVEILASCPGTFGTDTHAAAVVEAACVHCTAENQLLLARALVADEGLLLQMARHRKGSR